jgi:crotonobetainyl-CoA:carnitine CoA-transferase CaiB-like acyl-CoA transferase
VEPDFELAAPEAHDRLTRLVREVEDLFLTKTTAAWIEALRAGGVPCGPLNFPPDVFHDPQLVENGYVVDIEHPLFGTYRTFGPPLQMDATPTRIRSAAPQLDEHTDEVLAELGFAADERRHLRAHGVTGKATSA